MNAGPRGRWVLAGTILASTMGFIDGTALGVALPAIQRDLGANIAGIQWIVEIFALFLGALMLLAGSLADIQGRRLIFILGTILFAGASAWCGLAPNLTQMIVARAVQGIGAALLTPSSLAIIGAYFEDKQRAAAIGIWSSFTAIAGAFGPVLGGFLVDHGSWRWIFFINFPIAIAVIAIAALHIPESRDGDRAGIDGIGAVLATIGLFGVVYALVEASIGGWRGAVLPVLAGGIVCLIAFVYSQAHVRSPMMPLGLFRIPTFSGTNALTFLLYGALAAGMFYIPFDLIRVQHFSATAAGAALLPMIAMISLFAGYFGSLVPRVGAKRLLVVGPSIVAIGFILYAVPGIGGPYWTTFFPAAVVLGFGMSMVVSPLTSTVMEAAGREHSGLASAINNTVSRVAGLVALAALSLVLVAAATAYAGGTLDPLSDLSNSRAALAFVAGFRTVMVTCAGLAILSALCAFLWINPKPQAAS